MRNATLTFALLCVVSLHAQTPRVERQKEFAASLPAVKAALQNLGAYTGSRLPSLEGFVNLEGIRAGDFQRPYFEYKIDLEPSEAKGTVVKVRANVSAWNAGQNGEAAGYRNFESTGRLETDLLDRLSQYLVDKSDDPKVLTESIEKVRAQRAEAERQIAAIGNQEDGTPDTGKIKEGTEFASVSHPHVAIYSSPTDVSKVLVRSHLDDEFQILEQRGAWLKVALGSGASGWVKRTQVEISVATRVGQTEQAVRATPGFSIIRQNEDEFAGDWQKLRGKRALYLFAQPDGSAMNVATGDRWQFVQNVFSEQYRQISHTSQNSIEGLVIVFMDQGGGVAAVSFDDIRDWMEGTLTKAEFIKRCSLDPPSAFSTSPPATHPPGKRHSSLGPSTTLPRS